jgi:osmotically-inducible protein OsmY
MSRSISFLIVFGLLGFVSSSAFAQGRTGTTGSTGNTTSGSGNTGAASSATSALSSAASTAGGGGGSGGIGAQTAAPVGNEPTFNAGDGSLGAQVGQGFTGRQNTGFVGNRNAGASNQASLMQQFSQFANQGQQNRNNTSSRSSVPQPRPQLKIAFTSPQVNLTKTRVDLDDRLGRLAKIQGVGTTISDQGVVTLTGSVGSEDSRKLAEALARLEPGVRSVKNELVVTPAP